MKNRRVAPSDTRKQRLAVEIAFLTGIHYSKAKLAVDTVFTSVVASLRRKESVKYPGFGTFKIIPFKESEYFTTGKVKHRLTYRVKFIPSTILKKMIKSNDY